MENKQLVKVDGEPVFTALYSMEQMKAIEWCHDRTRTMAKASIILGIVANLLCILLLVLVLLKR